MTARKVTSLRLHPDKIAAINRAADAAGVDRTEWLEAAIDAALAGDTKGKPIDALVAIADRVVEELGEAGPARRKVLEPALRRIVAAWKAGKVM